MLPLLAARRTMLPLLAAHSRRAPLLRAAAARPVSALPPPPPPSTPSPAPAKGGALAALKENGSSRRFTAPSILRRSRSPSQPSAPATILGWTRSKRSKRSTPRRLSSARSASRPRLRRSRGRQAQCWHTFSTRSPSSRACRPRSRSRRDSKRRSRTGSKLSGNRGH